MKTETELSDQPLKPRRSKSRQVSSRFLSPLHDEGIKSPTQTSSPLRGHKTSSTRRHRSLEDPGFGTSLWPSSSPSHPSNAKNLGTLGDHLKNDRMEDFLERKKDYKSGSRNDNRVLLSKQKSSNKIFGRFERGKNKENSKENYRPVLGGSMRHTGKLQIIPGKFTSSSSSSSNSLIVSDFGIVPGRLSVDENALYRNSKLVTPSQRSLDNFADSHDSESEYSDICSGTGFPSPSVVRSPRKSGIEVSSKYLLDVQRTRRDISDSDIQKPVSLDGLSPKLKKFTIKNAIKRANSLTAGYKSATSQWALSPGRSGSPPISIESKERLVSFSGLKPPSSPSRPKGVEKLLNLGLDLFKGKKSSASTSSLLVGSTNEESIHQLKLFHNRILQWRYANARADTVNRNINRHVENNLLYAGDGFAKLQQSVLQKRLQFQEEKLEMKLGFILHSQITLLETWGDMERQHLSAVSMLKECLHSVICRVPLIDGAKVDPKSIATALRNASDIATSVESALAVFSPSAETIAVYLSQLAEVVAQEKLILEECLEVLLAISELEMKERSLKCYLIQSNLRQQQLQQEQEEISS